MAQTTRDRSTEKPRSAAPADASSPSTERRTACTIRITLARVDGEPPYDRRCLASPDPAYVSPGTTLVWTCDHPFAVMFEGDTPIEHAPRYDGAAGHRDDTERSDGAAHSAATVVSGIAARVRPYRYAVSVCADGVVYMVDPEVVVSPDPGPRTLQPI